MARAEVHPRTTVWPRDRRCCLALGGPPGPWQGTGLCHSDPHLRMGARASQGRCKVPTPTAVPSTHCFPDPPTWSTGPRPCLRQLARGPGAPSEPPPMEDVTATFGALGPGLGPWSSEPVLACPPCPPHPRPAAERTLGPGEHGGDEVRCDSPREPGRRLPSLGTSMHWRVRLGGSFLMPRSLQVSAMQELLEPEGVSI